MKKSFDAVVFDVLKVTPEEYAVSLSPLLSLVFTLNLCTGAFELDFAGLVEEMANKSCMWELMERVAQCWSK